MPATDAPYWVAMLTAGTLGTATGDWVAPVSVLASAGSLLVAIFLVVLLAAWRIGGMSIPWYWATIVAARTAGTTLGDFPAGRHGLNLGLSVSTSLTACHARRCGRALAAPAGDRQRGGNVELTSPPLRKERQS